MTAAAGKDDPFLVYKAPRDETASVEPVADDAAPKAAGAFRSIGEAAAELGLKTHVLRFWETKFEALKPLKRPDGRRYYRPEDMETLRRLQDLLHVRGLTIRGAIKVLNGEVSWEEAAREEPGEGPSVHGLQDALREAVERGVFHGEGDEAGASAAAPASDARARLESVLEDLSSLKSRLDRVRNAA